MNLNENINRIKQVMGLLNEWSVSNVIRPKGDPYIYAKASDNHYLAYKCGKNKPCPSIDLIDWIDVTDGKANNKPGYFKYENAIKKLIYDETGANDLLYKFINKIPLTQEELNVEGDLNLQYSENITLPDGLKINGDLILIKSDISSLPKALEVGGKIQIWINTNMTTLPEDLKVNGDLIISNTNITTLPKNLKVGGDLDLRNCQKLTALPEVLDVGGSFDLSSCSKITKLPNTLKVKSNIDLSNSNITEIPNNLSVGGDLNLYACKNLTSLPIGLEVMGNLNLSISQNLNSLPNDLKVNGELNVYDTGLSNYTEEQLKEMVKPNGYIKGPIVGAKS